MLPRRFKRACSCLLSLAYITVTSAAAQPNANWLAGKDLMKALQRGGFVLVMRHASSPHTTPTRQTADTDNVNLERQLDDTGRATSRAMGMAMQRLNIPVGKVLVSPMYRARLTANLAGWRQAQSVQELSESAQGMRGAEIGQAHWLRAQAIQPPAKNTNTVIVTHLPNIVAAFGDEWADLKDGETLVFHPDGKGGVIAAARIKIEQWPMLGN